MDESTLTRLEVEAIRNLPSAFKTQPINIFHNGNGRVYISTVECQDVLIWDGKWSYNGNNQDETQLEKKINNNA